MSVPCKDVVFIFRIEVRTGLFWVEQHPASTLLWSTWCHFYFHYTTFWMELTHNLGEVHKTRDFSLFLWWTKNCSSTCHYLAFFSKAPSTTGPLPYPTTKTSWLHKSRRCSTPVLMIRGITCTLFDANGYKQSLQKRHVILKSILPLHMTLPTSNCLFSNQGVWQALKAEKSSFFVLNIRWRCTTTEGGLEAVLWIELEDRYFSRVQMFYNIIWRKLAHPLYLIVFYSSL